jgi:hypothetical protein
MVDKRVGKLEGPVTPLVCAPLGRRSLSRERRLASRERHRSSPGAAFSTNKHNHVDNHGEDYKTTTTTIHQPPPPLPQLPTPTTATTSEAHFPRLLRTFFSSLFFPLPSSKELRAVAGQSSLSPPLFFWHAVFFFPAPLTGLSVVRWIVGGPGVSRGGG